eukprot:m.139816 g.139816  ORF g.139816 m.139816 type:complete len:683 (+) comp30083_c0_seq2:78-2126(+)
MFTPPRGAAAGSPMRRSRKSTSCLSPASPKLHIQENDDKQEKTMRRRSKLAEINHNSPYRSSPLKRANREVPATAKLSNDQLSALISATIEGQVKRKITSKNAFEWNLIDYLSEICTTQENVDMPSFSTLANVIDASGEIYASKVEHLLADTIKVRTDLSRSSTGKSASNEDDSTDDAPTKTKAHRFSGNTIVKNVSTITMDKLDLEFSVDPLFRKTSAAFDQGGARGLLLNHLTTQGLSELKFDSSDSTDPVAHAKSVTSSPLDMDVVRELFPFAEINESKPQICPEFASFKFSGWDPVTSKETINDGTNNGIEVAPTQTMTVDTEYTEDVYEQDDDVAFDQSFSEMPESEEPFMATDGADGVVDTHRQANTNGKREIVLLQNNTFGWLEGNVGGAGGWHGGSEFSVAAKKGVKKGGVSKAVKKAKFILKIELDFDWKKLLGASRAATTLAKSTTEATVSNLLPDDLQRAAKDLTTLFLMPKRQGKVLTRKYGDSEDDDNMDDWANGSTFGDDAYIPNDSNGDDYNDTDSPIPLFDGCDDDDDDNEQDDMDMDIPAGPQSDENGNLKLIENVRQVQKINIGYAQKPKIMDIKKLKASIWDEISENVSSTTANSDGSTALEEKPLLFNQLVTDVPHKVSSKMAENLSVPIMFVCLLYLANDKELRISGVDSMENLQILQKAE